MVSVPTLEISISEISIISSGENVAAPGNPLLTPELLTSELSKYNSEEKTNKSFESDIAVDQTWSEWMEELPGSSYRKVARFTECQWRWSKNLANYGHLPEWLKDNKFLLSRHRLPIYSFTGCILSAFRCHSETGNIWTHLIGSLVSLGLSIYCFASRLYLLHWTEQAVYSAFFLSGILCMGFSCIFHTVINHSPKMFKLFSRLDYAGIALLVIGSNVPWMYYAHFCRPLCYVIYTCAICAIGISGTIVTLWSEFDKPKYRTFRAAVFLAMGLSAIVPGAHYVIAFGWEESVEEASLGWMILMGCFYVVGTTLFIMQVPERFLPGKFDLVFHSHQIMHVFVFIAFVVCYHALSLLEARHGIAIVKGTLCKNNILNITSWS